MHIFSKLFVALKKRQKKEEKHLEGTFPQQTSCQEVRFLIG